MKLTTLTILTAFVLILVAWRYLNLFVSLDELFQLVKDEKSEEGNFTPTKRDKQIGRKVMGRQIKISVRFLILVLVAIGLAIPIVMGGLYLLKLNQG